MEREPFACPGILTMHGAFHRFGPNPSEFRMRQPPHLLSSARRSLHGGEGDEGGDGMISMYRRDGKRETKEGKSNLFLSIHLHIRLPTQGRGGGILVEEFL